MKLLFMGVSAACCCILGLGWASAGRRCRVSHMDAFDTTACTTLSQYKLCLEQQYQASIQRWYYLRACGMLDVRGLSGNHCHIAKHVLYNLLHLLFHVPAV